MPNGEEPTGIRGFFVRAKEKGKSFLPGKGPTTKDKVVVNLYESDKWFLIVLGIFILGVQAVLLMPLIDNVLATGESPNRSRIEYVSYVDDNDNGRFDEEGLDLNDDGDFEDEGEYPPDTVVEDPDDAPEDEDVHTTIVKKEVERDSGVLAGVVILLPLLYVAFIVFIVGKQDNPMRVAFWLSIGYAAPIIIYVIILFILTLLWNLVVGFAGAAAISLGSQVASGAADGFASLANDATGWTGVELFDEGGGSRSTENAAAGGFSGNEANEFLDSQWDLLQETSVIIFATLIAIFITFMAIAIGVGGDAETFTTRFFRGWIYGIGIQLLVVFGIFSIFGIGTILGTG